MKNPPGQDGWTGCKPRPVWNGGCRLTKRGRSTLLKEFCEPLGHPDVKKWDLRSRDGGSVARKFDRSSTSIEEVELNPRHLFWGSSVP